MTLGAPGLTWVDGALIALKRPRGVAHRLALVISNGYLRRRRVSWLSQLTEASEEQVRKYLAEVEGDRQFLSEVRGIFRRHALYFPLPTDFMVAENGSTMFFHCVSLYAFTRLIRPSVVVETGGTPGKSSAFILRALQRNGHGHLYTVDLPPRETDEVIRASEVYSKRPHLAAANWCVPDWLRGQHTLLLGPAETHLPRLLSQVRDVCVFIHDSNHSYAHVRWELETAFPFVRVAGFLWADDIGTNTAWLDFCEKHQLERHDFTSQGVARKR